MTKIDFIYFDAGGGHRAAATALEAVVRRQSRPWQIRMVNLQDLLDSLDVFRKLTGVRLQDVYNLMLSKGWTLGSAQGLMFLHAVIRLYHSPTVRLLEQYWRAAPPDMAVSLVPNFNRALCQGLGAVRPEAPFVTLLTDLADYPPHFWIERQAQYLICGTARAAEQARELGHEQSRIFLTSGMILRPRFYEPVQADRRAERTRLGLDPDQPAGLVLFGGHGSKVMLEIARRLPRTQLILLCGRNHALAARLRALPDAQAPRLVVGFTEEVPYYMHLADFLIGKPGPGSISEAVAMKLPVIIERNAWTLPQERFNADWVQEKRAGVVLPSFRKVRRGVEEMVERLEQYRAQVARIENRAVFEIPDILARILGA